MKRSVLLALALYIGCQNDAPIVQNQDTMPTLGAVRIDSLVPAAGRVGDAVMIYGSGFDSLVWAGVSFSGARVAADSFTSAKIRVRVPPSASTGRVAVYTIRDSAVGPVFTVLPSCGALMCVAPYYGPPLTEQQSWAQDCRQRSVPWSGQVRTDSVVLSQGYCVGDDSYFIYLIRFKNDLGPNSLPTACDAFLIDREIHGTFTYTLNGVAYIQSWNTRDVVAGKVIWFDEPYHWWREFVFWYDFSP